MGRVHQAGRLQPDHAEKGSRRRATRRTPTRPSGGQAGAAGQQMRERSAAGARRSRRRAGGMTVAERGPGSPRRSPRGFQGDPCAAWRAMSRQQPQHRPGRTPPPAQQGRSRAARQGSDEKSEQHRRRGTATARTTEAGRLDQDRLSDPVEADQDGTRSRTTSRAASPAGCPAFRPVESEQSRNADAQNGKGVEWRESRGRE